MTINISLISKGPKPIKKLKGIKHKPIKPLKVNIEKLYMYVFFEISNNQPNILMAVCFAKKIMINPNKIKLKFIIPFGPP